MFHINEKNLHLSGNFFKKPEFFEEASHHFKKVFIPLKMFSKSLVIFEKASALLSKPPFF
jgi:hypothetical protein